MPYEGPIDYSGRSQGDMAEGRVRYTRKRGDAAGGDWQHQINIGYDVQGLISQLSEAQLSKMDLRSSWKRAVVAIAQSAEENIETEGATTGKPWDDLSEQYQNAKIRKHGTRAIGRRTGALFDQVTNPNNGYITNDSLNFGTKGLPYAVFFNFGVKTIKKRGGGGTFDVPQRRLLWWTDALREEVGQILGEGIISETHRTGLEVNAG